MKIVDFIVILVVCMLLSGMMLGIIFFVCLWFKLVMFDFDMMDYGLVKLWFEVVQCCMNEVFNKFNIYQLLLLFYVSLGNYSIGVMVVLEDDSDVICMMMFLIGSYYMVNFVCGSVDICFCKFFMIVCQLVMEFGFNNVSDLVKGMWDFGNYESWIEVIYVVYLNIDCDIVKFNSKNKLVKLVYYEVGGDSDKLLCEFGFDEFLIMVLCWEVNGEDVYGLFCLGMIVFGQVKVL